MPQLEQPSLSRSTLDRQAHLRTEPDLFDRLLREPQTRLVYLDDEGRIAVRDVEDGARLVSRALSDLPADLSQSLRASQSSTEGVLAYLGQGEDGSQYLLANGAGTIGPGERLATLREVGAVLDDAGAGLFTGALALANWHRSHPRCSRCGTATDIVDGGWARSCPNCGARHFPRTDAAVIMAIIDPADRILLGHQAVWPDKRFSTLAGFVEPGESLEAAVRREAAEEAGVRVGAVEYQGSQPWPFPSSLMLGFTGYAETDEITVDGVELEQAHWWSREELALDVATDEVLLPPPVSIARRLIEQWYGGPIRDGGGSWR